VDAVKNFPAKFVEEVTFVCFDEENFEIYKRRLE
jgi:O-acetyl-ADP-ribose deacetylase (regulator of RNase III)